MEEVQRSQASEARSLKRHRRRDMDHYRSLIKHHPSFSQESKFEDMDSLFKSEPEFKTLTESDRRESFEKALQRLLVKNSEEDSYRRGGSGGSGAEFHGHSHGHSHGRGRVRGDRHGDGDEGDEDLRELKPRKRRPSSVASLDESGRSLTKKSHPETSTRHRGEDTQRLDPEEEGPSSRDLSGRNRGSGGVSSGRERSERRRKTSGRGSTSRERGILDNDGGVSGGGTAPLTPLTPLGDESGKNSSPSQTLESVSRVVSREKRASHSTKKSQPHLTRDGNPMESSEEEGVISE